MFSDQSHHTARKPHRDPDASPAPTGTSRRPPSWPAPPSTTPPAPGTPPPRSRKRKPPTRRTSPSSADPGYCPSPRSAPAPAPPHRAATPTAPPPPRPRPPRPPALGAGAVRQQRPAPHPHDPHASDAAPDRHDTGSFGRTGILMASPSLLGHLVRGLIPQRMDPLSAGRRAQSLEKLPNSPPQGARRPVTRNSPGWPTPRRKRGGAALLRRCGWRPRVGRPPAPAAARGG